MFKQGELIMKSGNHTLNGSTTLKNGQYTVKEVRDMASRCQPPKFKPVRFSDYGDILTAQEAAQILHCGSENINYMCRKGQIPAAVKFGTAWRIPKKAIMELFGDYFGKED